MTSEFARISEGRSLGDRTTLIEHMDAVAEPHDDRHVVFDQQHAAVQAAADVADDLPQLVALALVEAGCRLIQQQEARTHGERTGDADTPLFPERQSIGPCRSLGRQTEPAQHFVRPLARPTAAEADAERARFHVLKHAEAAEEADSLKRPRHPVPRQLKRRPPGHVPAGEPHAALVRSLEPGQDIDEGGLARAVRPDEAKDFVLTQMQARAADRTHAFEPHMNVPRFQRPAIGGTHALHFLRPNGSFVVPQKTIEAALVGRNTPMALCLPSCTCMIVIGRVTLMCSSGE